MKPEKPVRLNPRSKQFCYEIQAVAKEAGLIPECPEYPEIFYWSDSLSKRKWRLGDDLRLEVSDDDFDRWANSGRAHERLPVTDYKLFELIQRMRVA